MFITPDPDEFFNAVFFVDPVTKTVDDSLVMSLSKDPLNADRYSRYLQVRSSSSSPRVDDETNFDLCLPRSVQSLSEHQAFNEKLSSFIRFLMKTISNGEQSSDTPDPSSSDTPDPSSSETTDPSSSDNS